MDTFEERLDVCIEALRTGRLTLEQCLALYPDDAPRLQPLLLTVVDLAHAYHVQPRAAFARDARERFLLATGEPLREAFGQVQPPQGFVRIARQRFLNAARQMLPGPSGPARPAVALPWMRLPAPALSGALTVALAFFAFAGFAFGTAGDALPGDWNYPLKRATENARLALSFDDDARQNLEIAFAEERLEEIEKLAKRDGRVSEDALASLASQTRRLRESLPSITSQQTRSRLISLTERQQDILAVVEDRVEPAAQDELAQAQEIAAEIRTSVAQTLATPSPTPAAAVTSPEATVTPEGSASPTATEAAGTPVPTEETPEATATPTPLPRPLPVEGSIVRGPSSDTTAGLTWEWLVTERYTYLVPTVDSGWTLTGAIFGEDGVADLSAVIRVTSGDGATIVAILPRSSDVVWFQFDGQVWSERQLRSAAPGAIIVADLDKIERDYPGIGAIVAHIVRSVEITPLPEPTATPTPSATGTPASSGP